MAEPKKSPSPEETSLRKSAPDVFEVERGSGLRERETTPAPPSAGMLAGESLQVSSRPTTVPDYDFTALAAGVSSLRHHAPPMIPHDVTIPVRTASVPPDDLHHRLAVLLFHVDGRTSIGQIAVSLDLPSTEVITSFVELTALGLVELATPR